MSKNTKIPHTKSCGNVYQDLGLADAEERLAKAQLAIRIDTIIEKKGYLQKEAAKILEINQPKVSALRNGKLEGFSMERLIHFLNLLNQDVEIVVKSRRGRSRLGKLHVAFG